MGGPFCLGVEQHFFRPSEPEIVVVASHPSLAEQWQFPNRTWGGGAFFGASDSGIAWNDVGNFPHCLQLFRLSISEDVKEKPVELQFSTPLFPTACTIRDGSLIRVFLLTADSNLHCVSVSNLGHASDSLLPGISKCSLLLATQLERIGSPNCLSASSSHVCISGKTGGILCIPVQAILEGIPESAFELVDQSWFGFVASSFVRTSQPGVVGMAGIVQSGIPCLCAIHEDASLRIWDLTARKCLPAEKIEGIPPSHLVGIQAVPGSTAVFHLLIQIQSPIGEATTIQVCDVDISTGRIVLSPRGAPATQPGPLAITECHVSLNGNIQAWASGAGWVGCFSDVANGQVGVQMLHVDDAATYGASISPQDQVCMLWPRACTIVVCRVTRADVTVVLLSECVVPTFEIRTRNS